MHSAIILSSGRGLAGCSNGGNRTGKAFLRLCVIIGKSCRGFCITIAKSTNDSQQLELITNTTSRIANNSCGIANDSAPHRPED